MKHDLCIPKLRWPVDVPLLSKQYSPIPCTFNKKRKLKMSNGVLIFVDIAANFRVPSLFPIVPRLVSSESRHRHYELIRRIPIGDAYWTKNARLTSQEIFDIKPDKSSYAFCFGSITLPAYCKRRQISVLQFKPTQHKTTTYVN